MQSVAVFNNKGGVGKTTFVCNLAASLKHHKDKKILVVDADPQCNATQYMFGIPRLSEIYNDDEFTLLDVMKPLAQGKGFVRKLITTESPRFGVDVIPGDPGMSLEEDRLATDWVQATGGDIRGLRTTFIFAQLLSQCEEYDYVFFDMGPSLGSINRAVLVAADFFITPMSTDIFSVKAIENISLSLSTWRKKLNRALDDVSDRLDELEVDSPEWKLQFLGYLTQQYLTKTIRGTKQPVNAFDKIIKQIPTEINKRLIVPFTDKPRPRVSFEIGAIPLLNSLVPLAQTANCPIFDLKARDGVVGAHFTKVREYREVIERICDRFLIQAEALS